MVREASAHDQILRAVAAMDLPVSSRILVAVSGGPDSMALLDAIDWLARQPDRSWSIRVLHVNHTLRGEESEGDEAFVRSEAARRGLPADVVRVDTRAEARKRRKSLETIARETRYRALLEALVAWPGDVIATGHTLDDQAETIIFRLLRGAGLLGLGGMRARSDRLVRPLLGVSRDTIEQALVERRLEYRVDRSNQDWAHVRNRIRHDVMPALKTVQPQATRTLARAASLLRTDEEYLRREAGETLSILEISRQETSIRLSRPVWLALHPSLQRHTLRLAIGRVLPGLEDVEERHVLALIQALESAGTTIRSQLPRGLDLSIDDDAFVLAVGERPVPLSMEPSTLEVPGVVDVEIGQIVATVLRPPDETTVRHWLAVCGQLHALCDADRLGTHLRVRSRLPGDRMRPLGLQGSRKLQDIFVDRHVPRAQRDRFVVIENETQIAWVPWLALDERVGINESTTRFVHLRLEPKGQVTMLQCVTKS